jgi:hypothetical protein
MGHVVAQWLRHSATIMMEAGPIRNGVVGIFHLYNPSGRTMVMVSTQPLTDMSVKYFIGLNAAGAYGWQPCHINVAIVLIYWSFNFLEPSGSVKACNGIALPYRCKYGMRLI